MEVLLSNIFQDALIQPPKVDNCNYSAKRNYAVLFLRVTECDLQPTTSSRIEKEKRINEAWGDSVCEMIPSSELWEMTCRTCGSES